MKFCLPLLFAASMLAACGTPTDHSAQVAAPEATADTTATEAPAEETGFDAELAAKLGADDYGMHQYVMAFLYKGPNRSEDPDGAAKLQAAHMENIGRLAEAGKLVLAGPFMDDGDLRGIYIFDVDTVEEAAALTATDPAIQSGSLRMELHPWYGSAAVMGINELHGKISKEEI